MKSLPDIRRHFVACVLCAASLTWGAAVVSLHAQEEGTTDVEGAPATPDVSTQTQERPETTPPVESEAPADNTPPTRSPQAEDPDETTVHLNELISIMNSAHLRRNEVTPEMVTVMGNSVVEGRVNGDCVTVMGNVTVTGTVRGSLICIMGTLTLGPGAEVHGETVAVGGAMRIDPTARIRGEKVAVTIPGIGGSLGWIGEWFQDGLGKLRILPHNRPWAWSVAGFFVALNLLFALMFRGAITASVRALETRPVLTFVNGALVFLLFPIVLILLVASAIGILLVPFALAGLFIAAFLGTIGIYRFCGDQLGLGDRPLLAVLVGNVIFILLYALPVVGLAVWCMTGLMGLGAAVTAIGNRRREARLEGSTPVGPTPPSSASGIPASVTPAVEATPQNPVWMGPPPPVATTGPASATSPSAAGPASGTVSFAAPSGARTGGTTFVPPYSGWTPPPESASAAAPLPPLPTEHTIERATFWPRLGALAIDFIFVAMVSAFISAPPSLVVLLLVAYHVAFWSWRATTPGGIVFNLRVTRLDRTPVTAGVAIVRALGGVFSMLPAGLGFIWVSFDDERQAWHDKLAGTVVERVGRATPLV